MSNAPLSIKLRCASWAQLASIHKRDLSRGALFLKSAAAPPAMGTPVNVALMLPSATLINLTGVVHAHIPATDPSGRGPGIDVKLAPIPPSAMWLIENALQSEQRVRAASENAEAKAASVVTPIPGLNDSADLSNAENALVATLKSELESLRKLNPFQVLGVGYESGDAEVRSAFADLTKRYHPDRFSRYQSEALRKLAAEIFILIRDAYRRLGDAAGRTAAMTAAGYVAAPPRTVAAPRAATAPVPPVPRSTRAPTVNEAPRVVRASTSVGNDTPADLGAPPLMSPLGQLDTERRPVAAPPPVLQGDIARDQASIEALLDDGKFTDALAAYKVMAKINSQDRVARAGIELCEGLRALANKDRLEAAQRFESVLEIDPSNERAARELAEMRRMATNERKGLLTKLMNKKD